MDLIKKIKIGDIAVILSVVLIALLIICGRFIGKDAGSVVFVNINGDERMFDLDNDRTVNLYCGEHTLKMVIKNRTVYVSEANCPDKYCVNTGSISNAGECIVCVPAKTYIKIISEKGVDYDYVIG